jgi:membrane glycosyltransferase
VSSEEVSQDELADQLDSYSELISTQTRTINFGILGLTWVFLIAKSDVPAAVVISRRVALSIALCSLLAILAEFGQYLFAERSVYDTFDRAEADPSGKASYDAEAISYRAAWVCYRLKMLLTLLAALLFVFVLGREILTLPT